jgi:DNA-binding FrmR family transcriptional regulator
MKGQMEAVERALEAEAPCGDVLQLLASIRGALAGLTGEIVEGHLHEHVVHAENEAERQKAADELAGVLKTYIR